MLDQEFCQFLEYEISKALGNSESKELMGFWCDGILLSEPENHYSKKVINDNRQVLMKAFIGVDGQSHYLLTLKFGRKALSRYARELDIKECIPDQHRTDWYIIDIEQKTIEIQLD